MASQAPYDATPTAKQLVFLLMAATVVAVVVFLCGVMVGRGVPPAEGRAGPMSDPVGGAALGGEELRPPVPDSVGREPSVAAGSSDELTYYRRLGSNEPISDTVRTESAESGIPALDSAGAVPEIEPEPASSVRPLQSDAGEQSAAVVVDPPRELPTNALASSEGYTVQLTALRRVEVARQVADRLLSKGIPAYVLQPASDSPVAVYRVRVGRYADRGEAEQMLRRLEREEQFKPWITR